MVTTRELEEELIKPNRGNFYIQVNTPNKHSRFDKIKFNLHKFGGSGNV